MMISFLVTHVPQLKFLTSPYDKVTGARKTNRHSCRDSREPLWSRSFLRKLVRLSVDLNEGLRENAAMSRVGPNRCDLDAASPRIAEQFLRMGGIFL